MSTLDSIARGVAASAVGTLAMDTWLYRGYRHGGGDVGFANWESSVGVASWEDAPAPAKVAKRLLAVVVRRDVPPRYARALNNATDWAFGLDADAAYGLLLGSGHTSSKVAYGPPFGAAVWAGGYVVLPVLGVYEPIWDYDLETLGKDLRAHVVFGTVTAAAYSLLPGEAGP
jgi:hypothetical protein